jgi:hypothetical protein
LRDGGEQELIARTARFPEAQAIQLQNALELPLPPVSGAGHVVIAGTMVLSILLVQTPGLAGLLHLEPLHADDWMLAVGGGLLASLLSVAASIRPFAPAGEA